MIRILRVNVPLGMVEARSGKRCPPPARALGLAAEGMPLYPDIVPGNSA